MITVTGRVVDEHGNPLNNLTVEARGDWLLTSKQLAHDTTTNAGRFTLGVPEILDFRKCPARFMSG